MRESTVHWYNGLAHSIIELSYMSGIFLNEKLQPYMYHRLGICTSDSRMGVIVAIQLDS